jgi:GT2 family glycosyltransferase
VSVVVIIPTLLANPKLLIQCFEALAKQKHVDRFSVCVVANTQAKQIDQFVDKLPKTITLQLQPRFITLGSNYGFAGAVNAGIQATSEEFVILLNDDAEPAPDWLSELLNTHKATSADMIASNIYLADRETLDSQGFTFRWRGQAITLPYTDHAADNWLKHPDLLPEGKNSHHEPFGPDAAAALYTRKLLADVDGFKNSFFAYLEDVDVALRARQKGYTCALSTKAIVYHHKHSTSQKWSGFKVRQDFLNWWRIVLQDYSWPIWRRFSLLIFVERARNLSGLIKNWF